MGQISEMMMCDSDVGKSESAYSQQHIKMSFSTWNVFSDGEMP